MTRCLESAGQVLESERPDPASPPARVSVALALSVQGLSDPAPSVPAALARSAQVDPALSGLAVPDP